MYLTSNEKRIYNFCKSRAFVTVSHLSDHLNMNYRTTLRNMDKLVEKGMLYKGKRHEDGYHYSIAIKVVNDYEAKFVIPFKKKEFTLPELLMYLAQDVPDNDFEIYGSVIQSAVYHLAYRASQIREGSPPNSPSPHEIRSFLQGAADKYRDFVRLIEILEGLPIYDDNPDVVSCFSPVDHKFLDYQENEVFKAVWGNVATPHGLKERIYSTLSRMRARSKKAS